MESDDPKHYKDKDIETWDAIHSQVSDEEFIVYLKGSAAKHLFRFGSKGGLTIEKAIMDTKKSIKYLSKLLNFLEWHRKQGNRVQEEKPKPSNVRNLFKDKDNEWK